MQRLIPEYFQCDANYYFCLQIWKLHYVYFDRQINRNNQCTFLNASISIHLDFFQLCINVGTSLFHQVLLSLIIVYGVLFNAFTYASPYSHSISRIRRSITDEEYMDVSAIDQHTKTGKNQPRDQRSSLVSQVCSLLDLSFQFIVLPICSLSTSETEFVLIIAVMSFT